MMRWVIGLSLMMLSDIVFAAGGFTVLATPAEPAGWTVTSQDGAMPAVTAGEMRQGIRLTFERPAANTVYTLTLEKPVALPADARRVGMWLYTAGRFWGDGPAVRFLLRDKTGVGYSYALYGSEPAPGAWNYLECPRLRGGELGRLDETMILVEGGLQHHLPVAPLRLEGIELRIGSANWIPKAQTIELGAFSADGIRREDSACYWQCDLGQRYLFGEMPFARQPFITAGDLVQEQGDFTIAWQARSACFGRSVAQGTWTLAGYDAGVAARFRRLEMPLTARGQYWVTFKITDDRKGTARFVETRVKVIRGSDAQAGPLPADVRPAGALLVLNPQRDGSVYAPGELTRCVVRAWRPERNADGAAQLTVTRSRYPAGQIGAEERYPVVWPEGAEFVDIPIPLALTAEAPMQKLDVRLLAGNRELDRLSQLVGQQALPDAAPWTHRDQVLRYADIFENGNHLLCCAEWDPRYSQNTDPAKFEEWVLDVKRQNVNTIELFPKWGEIEPMPGVFWWDQLDTRLAIIAKHDLHAMINLDCTYVPAWMIEESQADEEGMVNGLWHGGGNNVLKSPNSPALWQYYGEYLTHLALRYRDNPALAAYSSLTIFFDHMWADHPWQGQYVDYSEAAKAGFRAYLRDARGFTLAALSQRWGRPLRSWDDVTLPRTDLFLGLATIDRPDPRPEWRDFLDFRLWSQQRFITGLVAGTVRKYDDLRPIGTHGLLADAQWYRDNNMFICAGSSEGSLDARRTPYPFPKRAESILMSFYTPYYTAICMTNLLAEHNLNVQHFWMPNWRWDDCAGEDRKTGAQSLAGWLALFQGDLGKATPIHAAGTEPAPVLGLLYSRASILYGVRSFHWPRLDDYRLPAERACPVPKTSLYEDVTAEELAKLPCVVVDPTSRIFPKETLERLAAYVKNGGRLVLAPTGGQFTLDPADSEHVLRRLLGLPIPASRWQMAKEYRQPGTYAPYYPWDISGKGTPGEQSLAEPGQTAQAVPAAGSLFADGRKLVFRIGPYSMYNRDTWADWAHMLPYFIYGRYKESKVAGTAVATWTDGGPAATLHAVGKGQVLLLWGTPDWFNWRDALADIARWAAPAAPRETTVQPQPYTLAPAACKGFLLARDDIRWAVIRNESTGWTAIYGNSAKQAGVPRTRGTITIPNLPAARYRVRDITPLLSQGLDQVLTREQLAAEGISADLIPSETRIFRLDPL